MFGPGGPSAAELRRWVSGAEPKVVFAMRNSQAVVLVATSLFAVGSFAQSDLCTKDEVTVWSCSTTAKVYSLCASRDLSPTAGYLQYRAGKSPTPEFAFPDSPRHPKGHFLLRLAPRGASLSFTNGDYGYWIYEPLAGSTTIDVSKGGTSIGTVTCAWSTDTLTLTETQNRFQALGIYQHHHHEH